MTDAPYPPGWYPLALAKDVRAKPLMLRLAGASLRLLRGPNTVVCAFEGETGNPVAVREAGGWVLASIGDPDTDDMSAVPIMNGPYAIARIDGHVRAGLADVAENILDTTHTSVVHQDYLRAPGSRRQVDAHLASGTGWISATYPPGAAPSGWGARLLGAHRYTIRDRFSTPAVAEVLYTEDDRPVFASRFALTPVCEGETYVAATLAVPGNGPLAALKLAALQLFFRRIFAEDREILELIGANRAAHRGGPLVFAPQDLLRPGIEAILGGRVPVAAPSRIALKV